MWRGDFSPAISSPLALGQILVKGANDALARSALGPTTTRVRDGAGTAARELAHRDASADKLPRHVRRQDRDDAKSLDFGIGYQAERRSPDRRARQLEGGAGRSGGSWGGRLLCPRAARDREHDRASQDDRAHLAGLDDSTPELS